MKNKDIFQFLLSTGHPISHCRKALFVLLDKDQSKVASQLNITAGHLSNILAGKKRHLRHGGKLAQIVKVPLNLLFNNDS